MPVSVSTQALIFIQSVAGGIIIAFIYDLFRIKRKAVRSRTISIYIEDFLFWILVALVMFGVVYRSNDGEVRGYIFLGTFIGLVLYMLLLSRVVMKVSLKIIEIAVKVFKILWRVVSYPFRILYRILRVPLGFLLRGLRRGWKQTRRMGRRRLSRLSMGRKIFKNARKKI